MSLLFPVSPFSLLLFRSFSLFIIFYYIHINNSSLYIFNNWISLWCAKIFILLNNCSEPLYEHNWCPKLLVSHWSELILFSKRTHCVATVAWRSLRFCSSYKHWGPHQGDFDAFCIFIWPFILVNVWLKRLLFYNWSLILSGFLNQILYYFSLSISLPFSIDHYSIYLNPMFFFVFAPRSPLPTTSAHSGAVMHGLALPWWSVEGFGHVFVAQTVQGSWGVSSPALTHSHEGQDVFPVAADADQCQHLPTH